MVAIYDRLLVVSVHLLVVCSHLLVVCGSLLMVCGGLWSLPILVTLHVTVVNASLNGLILVVCKC